MYQISQIHKYALWFHEFFSDFYYNSSVCYSTKSGRRLSKQFLCVIWKKCRQIRVQVTNVSNLIRHFANNHLKITPDCWQQSYLLFSNQKKPNFATKKPTIIGWHNFNDVAKNSQILSLTKETNKTGRNLSKWRIQILGIVQKIISFLPLFDTYNLK